MTHSLKNTILEIQVMLRWETEKGKEERKGGRERGERREGEGGTGEQGENEYVLKRRK